MKASLAYVIINLVLSGYTINDNAWPLDGNQDYQQNEPIYNILQAALLAMGESRVILSASKPESRPRETNVDHDIINAILRFYGSQTLNTTFLDVISQLADDESDKAKVGRPVRLELETNNLVESERRMSLIEALHYLPGDMLRSRRRKAVRFQEAKQRTADWNPFYANLAKRTAVEVVGLPDIYMDMCKSFSEFQLVDFAINDHYKRVQILPNTWVWTTKCVNPNENCPAVDKNVTAHCKQKQSWVQAFARMTENDPWRWHWILVDSSCNCGIRFKW